MGCHVGQKSRAMCAKNNLSHKFLQLSQTRSGVLNRDFPCEAIHSILCALMIDPPAVRATSAISVLKLEPEQIMV